MKIDRVITAGEVETLDAVTGATPSAVALHEGVITAVGGPELLQACRGSDAKVTEFPGATILPGFTDAHTHPVWGSVDAETGLDLAGESTLDQVCRRVGERLRDLPHGEWVTGFNLDVNVFDDAPGGAVFEREFPDAPVSLMTNDAHALVVSPRVVELCGLTGREVFDDASQVVVGADGAPSGYVLELQAMDLVLAHYARPPVAETAAHVAKHLGLFAAAGVTQVHALDFADPSEDVLREIERTGELPVRVRASPLVPADSGVAAWRHALDLQGVGGRRWEVRGAKFMLDGTADNGSAWFDEPDCLDQNTRPLWKDLGAYRRAVRFFTGHGVPTATHAIGDRAVRFVLDVIEEVGHPERGPHRIEHVESVPDDLVGRFSEVGAVASMQPTHATRMTRADQSDNWSRRLGPERAAHGWRIRDLIDAGATVALGSDWPIGHRDPRVTMADAQLRRPVERASVPAVQPDQRISAREAHLGMTRGPALAAGLGPVAGRVAPGYRGDLTVLARNPLTLTPQDQAANPVLATVVAGDVIRHI